MFAAITAGQVASMAPDFMQGKVSAARIFQIIDRVPAIDSFSTEGDTLVNTVLSLYQYFISYFYLLNVFLLIWMLHYNDRELARDTRGLQRTLKWGVVNKWRLLSRSLRVALFVIGDWGICQQSRQS